ncbi:hypothetical protein [Microcoleus sp. FACHB-68]|uniref:hypothetical protein n=1 Tax=Microcoleus sp. FACHB-68 TaxID=2692826 RepID=UPI0016846212|nr:hypothetical protein [Microcoleus sp. FACHB-68]MBD1935960.1 hypothetical protein [Microcoleus sp. FACHB-68]
MAFALAVGQFLIKTNRGDLDVQNPHLYALDDPAYHTLKNTAAAAIPAICQKMISAKPGAQS